MFVAIIVAALVLLYLVDVVPGLSGLFNVHSATGGAFLLFLFILAAFCSLGLALVLPWAVIVYWRLQSARTLPNSTLLLAGTLGLSLICWWLVQVVRHKHPV